jgi:hypothetical protein
LSIVALVPTLDGGRGVLGFLGVRLAEREADLALRSVILVVLINVFSPSPVGW